MGLYEVVGVGFAFVIGVVGCRGVALNPDGGQGGASAGGTGTPGDAGTGVGGGTAGTGGSTGGAGTGANGGSGGDGSRGTVTLQLVLPATTSF